MLLLIDVGSVANVARYSKHDLMASDPDNYIHVGFLNRTMNYIKKYNPKWVGFCFEGKHNFRYEIFPEYKSRNNKRTPEQKKAYEEGKEKIAQLPDILTRIGFTGIHQFMGYEADDVMAAGAKRYGVRMPVTIVTTDHDLWMMLAYCSIHDPKTNKVMTEKGLRLEWDCSPADWRVMKTLAGCPNSDGVPGIPGVGEIRARKFIANDLSPTTKAYQAIMDPANQWIIDRNEKLTSLPGNNCPHPKLTKDLFSEQGFREVRKELCWKAKIGRWRLLSNWKNVSERRHE